MVMALSSTAIVLQTLDRRVDDHAGRAIFVPVLLTQDIAVISDCLLPCWRLPVVSSIAPDALSETELRMGQRHGPGIVSRPARSCRAGA